MLKRADFTYQNHSFRLFVCEVLYFIYIFVFGAYLYLYVDIIYVACLNLLAYERSLTHWGRVTHIRVGKLIIIGSDNGLSPGRRQASMWTNARILLIGPLGTNFSEILIGIQTFSLTKNALQNVVCEMTSILFRPQCVNLLAYERLLTKLWFSGLFCGLGSREENLSQRGKV